jgi:hypothetical protein
LTRLADSDVVRREYETEDRLVARARFPGLRGVTDKGLD